MSATWPRGRANVEGVSEAEIQQMLPAMLKRRREAITLMGEVMAALRHRHAESWISPARVRLSDGSWAEPEANCDKISLTVSHLYANSIRSYRRVGRSYACKSIG